jgi:DNA-binding beta-propeller fold protein YncE
MRLRKGEQPMLLRSLSILLAISLSLPAVPATAAGKETSGVLLVAEKGTTSLAIVDPTMAAVTARVPEGGITGHEVAASPDGRFAYVPIYGNSGVGKPGTDGSNLVAIDIASRKVVANLDFGHGVRPHCPVIGPKDGMLYVTTELDHSVTVIDPKSMKIVGAIPTGQGQSHMLTISHDGRRGYTANVGPGTVSVLDMQARKTLAIIPVSADTQRISISMDDRMVFTSDQTKPQLAVIDTATNKVAHWISLPGTGYGSAPTSDGRWLLLAMPEVNQVAVIDLQTLKVAKTIGVPPSPQEVLIRPDGKAAYVSCDKSSEVAEIDLANWKVAHLIQTGKTADGLAWATAH